MKNTQIEPLPAVPLHRLVRRFFGFPVWTEDHDGETRKRWAKPQPDGRLAIFGLAGWELANLDGSFGPKSYMVQWTHRASIFSANVSEQERREERP